ncbi:MAG: HAMP domain-containing histidine kinase, partial [Eubacterium sp.]|nr:HAMP domain-containing histidine kinase [Eubacterium sp.]
SIIKNNLYKIIVTLRSQQELLLKDKNYLAESLADISHQLKTPITSITMMSDLLKKEEDEEKRKEFSEVIENQLSRMNWLIVTLLKLSKIDAGATEFKNSNENLKQILKKAAQPFMLGAEINGIDLSVACEEDISVYVDANWYIEAVSNIIKNCIEHTQEGGFVKVSAKETAVFTRISIQDNGSGIAKEDLPHVFERFYQGKNHSEASVGIGLALSKAIFNNQNSIVEVKSKENCGTEFEITIHKVIV